MVSSERKGGKKDDEQVQTPVSKLHGDGVAATANLPQKNPFNFDLIKNSFWVHKVSGIKILFPNFHKSYRVVFEKSSVYFTSPMKIS